MSNTHKAFIVAETMVHSDGMEAALQFIGMTQKHAADWVKDHGGQPDGELLIEFMGRLCYKSFKVGLNPNVTKIREDSHAYLGNILAQKHGSVMEHSTVTFALCNVSRIFTHELVRHRAGTAFSQESQRFVRLDDFKLYIPDLTEALYDLCPEQPLLTGPNPDVGSGDDDDPLDPTPDTVKTLITRDAWVQLQQDRFVLMADRIKDKVTQEVSDYVKEIGLDAEGVSFHTKKLVTSALRRLIPGGVNTNIGITANHRTWRHLISNRTAAGAEIEIREVFQDIADQLSDKFPAIYQDIRWGAFSEGSPLRAVTFTNEKI